MSASPSSPSRTGAFIIIAALDPWGMGRAFFRNTRSGSVLRGRQHDHPAARQDQLPLARPHLYPQGAGGDDRALAGGAADQEPDPQPLSLQRRLSATMSTACAPPPAIISTSRPSNLTLAQAAMLAGVVNAAEPARAEPPTSPPPAPAPIWCSRPWSKVGFITEAAARAPSGPRASASAPRDNVPTGTYFADWVLREANASTTRVMASAASARRSRATSSARRCAPCAAPGSAAPRRRWSRCGSTAGWWRWSAAAIMRKACSTAPPRRAASPARRSSSSSISPPSAPATGRTRWSTTRRSSVGDWSAAQL